MPPPSHPTNSRIHHFHLVKQESIGAIMVVNRGKPHLQTDSMYQTEPLMAHLAANFGDSPALVDLGRGKRSVGAGRNLFEYPRRLSR